MGPGRFFQWQAKKNLPDSIFVRPRALLLALVTVALVACGVKGPPLPPLVRVPVAPGDLTAERRGNRVDLHFVVPAENIDGSRPANIARVDVYALTGPTNVSDAVLLKRGTRIASVEVKAPRDPDLTVDPDESEEDMEPAEGEGLDQGAVAHLREELTPERLTPAPSMASTHATSAADAAPRPLLGPELSTAVRNYVAFGVGKRGRRGPASKRAGVPLIPPPPPPPTPTVTYTETTVTISWTAAEPPADGAPADADLLPSKPIGWSRPEIAYNVYETTPTEARLTKAPLNKRTFADERMTWGAERCYTVRTVETLSGLSIESDAPPPACTTLVDTFPPAAPKNLKSVPAEGLVNLIWDANEEKDLAGYIVLRSSGAGDTLEPITRQPIQDTRFEDHAPAGVRYVYAVQAVDKAGNKSELSNRVEESAR